MEPEEKKIRSGSTIFTIIMILVFLLGIGLRIGKANELPLNQIEASLALQVKGLFDNQPQLSQPFYSVITGLFFWLFEDSNSVARLLPVIVGSLLILVPWLMGDLLTDRVKLILSIGLALDPALMAASKTAGSHIIAVASAVLLLIFFLKRKPIFAGIALAAFFMTGANFIIGTLIFGLPILGVLIWDEDAKMLRSEYLTFSWKQMLITALLSYVLLSTAFLLVPGGIGSAFQDIANIYQPVTTLAVNPGITGILVALVLYEGFPLLFAAWHLVRNLQNSSLLSKICFSAILAGLLIILANPGKAALDLVWISIPLWLFAAQQVDKLVDGLQEVNLMTFAIGGFFLLMTGFILLTYVGAVNIDAINVALNYEGAQQKLMIRSMLIVGGILLIGISYFLSAYTWEPRVAQNALILGVGFYFLVFGLFSQTWHSAFLGANPSSELWHQSATLIDSELMTTTIEDLTEMYHGQRIDQPVMVVGLNSPALIWQLRDQDVGYAAALTSQDAPEMILTNLVDAQFWGAEYTGQDFRLSSTPNWSWLTIREWLSWMIYHKVEVTTEEMVILWVRTDLFPGQAGN